MPINETDPKEKTSKAWLARADELLGKFKKYHSARNIIGRQKNPGPLRDTYSRLLSDKELAARQKGMKYLREERKADLPGYRRGGAVRNTGPAVLHPGESVARKSARNGGRKGGRR